MSTAETPRDTDWEGIRLHVVTGKGGTGKTTVAAALALALAAEGRRILLVEVEGRQGLARVFDCPPLPYEERRVAVAPGGGDVLALAIDPQEALLDYLNMFYRLGRAGQSLRRIGAIDFATTIAPGLRDVLLTGKACEAVRRRSGGGYVYDAVVMDAPPTGRIVRFLNVNTEVAGLARMGPIRTQADAVMRVLRSPQTAVHLVTVLEEMPVQEMLDGIDELQAADLPVGGVVVNMVRPAPLPPEELAAAAAGEIGPERLAAGLGESGLHLRGASGAAVLTALLEETREHAERVRREATERATIEALDLPRYELPFLTGGIDRAALYDLAAALRMQGAA